MRKAGVPGGCCCRRPEAYAAQCKLTCLRLETRIELVENHRIFAKWGFIRTAEGRHPEFTHPTFIEMRKTL